MSRTEYTRVTIAVNRHNRHYVYMLISQYPNELVRLTLRYGKSKARGTVAQTEVYARNLPLCQQY